jgi:YD repeat-containing protein
MKHLTLTAALMALLFVQTGCDKSTDLPDTGTTPIINVQPVGVLLKSTAWNNGATEHFTHNADGTLKHTIGGLPNSAGQTRDFIYQDGNLVRIVKSDMKQEKYVYNPAGQINSITETLVGIENYGARLVFTYNVNGSLQTMKYYEFDDLKDILKATSTYEYDALNQLQKSILTYPAKPDQQLVYTFSNYSGEVKFTPWALLSTWDFLQPGYSFYNYPLLSRLTQLPGKITRKLLIGNAVQETVVKDFNYTITNKQLQKIEYLGSNTEVVFNY